MTIASEAECYELLGGGTIGRIGMVVDGKQVILPVNYATDGQSVVMKVGATSVLALNAPMAHVAFEVDDIDPTQRSGWSVLLWGVAHDVTNAIDEASESLRNLAVSPWASGEKACWLKITPLEVTGRRVP